MSNSRQELHLLGQLTCSVVDQGASLRFSLCADISHAQASNRLSTDLTVLKNALASLETSKAKTIEAVLSAKTLASNARRELAAGSQKNKHKGPGLSWEQCVQQVETCMQALLRISLREYCIFCLRLAADEALCDRLHVQSSDSRRLRISAAHLAEETRSAATLSRVQPGTSEYDRCCQAATGSVDVSLFDGSFPYSDMRVLDVHRTANAHCSAMFAQHSQRTAQHTQSKVKGMFVALSPDAVMPLATRGWHAPAADPSGFWDAKGQFLAALRAAIGMPPADTSLEFGTYARDAAAVQLDLPVFLSRHSAGHRDAAWLHSSVQPPTTSQHQQMYCDLAGVVARSMSLEDAEAAQLAPEALAGSLRAAGGGSTAIRYLCLCRVELGDAVPCEKYRGHAASVGEVGVGAALSSCVAAHEAAFTGAPYTPPLQCSCEGGVYVANASSLVADYVMQTVFTAAANDMASEASSTAPPCADLGQALDSSAAATAVEQLATAPLSTCTVLQSSAEAALKWSDVRRRALEWRSAVLAHLGGVVAGVCFGSRPHSHTHQAAGAAAWGSNLDTFCSVLLECFHYHAEFSRLIGSLAGSHVRRRIKAGAPPLSSLVDLQLPSPPPIVRYWKTASLQAAPSRQGGATVGATTVAEGDTAPAQARPKTGHANTKGSPVLSRVSSAAASSTGSRRHVLRGASSSSTPAASGHGRRGVRAGASRQ